MIALSCVKLRARIAPLQALTEIGVEYNSVIIVSLPVEDNATRIPGGVRQIDR
jgi:hypothetical protein